MLKRLVYNIRDHIIITLASFQGSREIYHAKRNDRKFVFRGRAE